MADELASGAKAADFTMMTPKSVVTAEQLAALDFDPVRAPDGLSEAQLRTQMLNLAQHAIVALRIVGCTKNELIGMVDGDPDTFAGLTEEMIEPANFAQAVHDTVQTAQLRLMSALAAAGRDRDAGAVNGHAQGGRAGATRRRLSTLGGRH